MRTPLLEINDLRTVFRTEYGLITAVDSVNLVVHPGETVGVVGESGSGKSVTALSIMRLIPTPPGHIVAGQIFFQGQDVVNLSEARMRHIRGNDISMIFQEPMTSLNPVYTCGRQIAEAVELHQGVSSRVAMQRAAAMLSLVGIPEPNKRVKEYPHQLSGGMRQRVMIAMALSCNPQLLIADEPTTALDVTIQAQILELIKGLKEKQNMAIILITHDLGVIAEMAERVVVMYAGKVVEEADAVSLFRQPLHPYTEGLLSAIPRLDCEMERLQIIEGVVPNPQEMPRGCRFHPRCPYVSERCRNHEPSLIDVDSNRRAACWHSAWVARAG